jgi:ankyrin repeat protein
MILKKILILILFTAFAVKALAQDNNALEITPLMSAVLEGDVKGVEFFTKFANEDVNSRNIGGASAISLAARSNNVEIVNLLIAAKAEINTIDNEGWTPLMRAAISGNVEILEILIKNNADVTKLNKFKESAIIHAANSNCQTCLELIMTKFDLSHKKTALLVKSQLADAFLIARNKENAQMQNSISAYLDQVVAIENTKNENTVFEIKDEEPVLEIKEEPIVKPAIKKVKKSKKSNFKLKKGVEAKSKNSKKIFKLKKSEKQNGQATKAKKFKLKKNNPKLNKTEKSETKYILKNPNNP